MLENLSLKNLALIDALELEFGAGFNVISGETGAGKSLSVDALGLLLGERARNDWIKAGAPSAEISAGFRVSVPNVRDFLDELELDSDYCLLRRVIKREGESRNFINGAGATVGQLKRLGALLADIQAQGDHQSLLAKGAALQILDNWGGCSELAGRVRALFGAWQKQRRELERLQANSAEDQLKHKLLTEEVAELAALDLEEGKFEQLEAEYQRLSSQQEAEQGCLEAQALLEDEGGEGILAAVARLQQLLARLQDAELDELVQQAHTQLEEARNSLRSRLAEINSSPMRLEEIDALLAQAHHLARKYRCKEQDLWSLLVAKQSELEQIDSSGDNCASLARAAEQSEAEYQTQAQQLSELRQQAATKLDERVQGRLRDLAITGPFRVQLEASTASAQGLESADFVYAAHHDLPLQPLRRVASGGELARVALALQVVIAGANKLPTLVLDEVDVGIGGATASKVGFMLQELSQHSQVICVTHQAQVAACADRHWRVSKDADARVQVDMLDAEQRILELARMAGGEVITATNIAAAEELLQQARS